MDAERICKECGETKRFAKGTWVTVQGKPRGVLCLTCATRKREAWQEKNKASAAQLENAEIALRRSHDGRRSKLRLPAGSPEPEARTCKDCGQEKRYAKGTWVTAKEKPVGWRCLECATKINNEWAAENREHAAKKALEWRNNNLERAREREAAWYRENPEANIRKAHVRRARIKQVGGKLSKGITKALFAKQQGKCASCNEQLSLEKGPDKAHLDHILPLALGGPNSDENVQLLCRLCNQRKGALHPNDWTTKSLSLPTDDRPVEKKV